MTVGVKLPVPPTDVLMGELICRAAEPDSPAWVIAREMLMSIR